VNLESCKFYELKRKRDLYRLLETNKNDVKSIKNDYTPYISNSKKKRLIEPTYCLELKKIQRNIANILQQMEYDESVFSGVKGKSYIDNGRLHLGSEYIIALDISKFFPNIHREKVYKFFFCDLKMSQDTASILSDLCCINLKKIEKDTNEVLDFIKENNIKAMNHVPTGSAVSCILSYLANYHMFNDIQKICEENNYKVSFYVDDIVISSANKFDVKVINNIVKIIIKSGYNIQKSKFKFYGKNEFKRVTGNIISKDGSVLVIPNKIKYKIIKLKKDKSIEPNNKANRLRGLNQIIIQTNK